MDDFSLDRPELTGSLLSLEFDSAGRIQQLWASDPINPTDSDEYQFIAPPFQMGEEVTEDYFPGTILIGARTDPDEPWIVARNAHATQIDDEFSSAITFEYDLGFLDELRAVGRFHEISGTVPLIAWDVEITNRSRRSVEIGELGFPMALNNVFEGFGRSDKELRDLFNERVYVHPFIGGGASYLFAERLNARPPGLLIFPGGDTKWEFITHVRNSLTTPFRWDGIPVIYVHSRGVIEREGWGDWFLGHSSLVLEPGESRTYHMRFVSADNFEGDGVHSTLSTIHRPGVRLYPSAVVPASVGATAEVIGTTPARFEVEGVAEVETEADESGGLCLIKPSKPGPMRVSFETIDGVAGECHLLFTHPIDELIRARADFILRHQVMRDEGPFQYAIVPADNRTGMALTDVGTFGTPYGVASSLGDALFLAEKNCLQPVREEIEAVDQYLERFVEQKLFNPGDLTVGSVLSQPRAVASYTGRPQTYPILMALYHSMAKVASGYGETTHDREHYLRRSVDVLRGLRQVLRSAEGCGLPLLQYAYDLLDDLKRDKSPLAEEVETWLKERSEEVLRRSYPFPSDSLWSTSGFAEAFTHAWRAGNQEKVERTLRCALAAKSLAASWWWYGSDKRWSEEPEGLAAPGMGDKGEFVHGPNSIANSLLYFQTLNQDTAYLNELALRASFGGVLGVWSLVRIDGAAGTGFCPDAASDQFGMSWTTGEIGVTLFQYLRSIASYVLPMRGTGVHTFGCHFEVPDTDPIEEFVVRPWDGVGRRIVVRHLGVEAKCENARMLQLRFSADKRSASVLLQNTSDKDLDAQLEIRGLWGLRFEVDDAEAFSEGGALRFSAKVPRNDLARVEVQVMG